MSRLVFLDTETTSLDDERGEVWEIAAIVRDPGQDDTEYLWQVRPDLATADPKSLEISRYYQRRRLSIHATNEAATMLSPDLVEEYGPHPTPEHTGANDVALRLAGLLDGAHVVGGNPAFDFRFLRRFLRAQNECWTAHYHLIDIQALTVGWLYGKAAELKKAQPHVDWSWTLDEITELPWKSTALYRATGVDPDRFEAHTALGDARLVRAIFDAITGSGVAR